MRDLEMGSRCGRRDVWRWGGMLLGVALLAACRAQGAATSDTVELTLATEGEQMAFDPTSLAVGAGQHVRLTLNNRSSVMQHNWVLVNGDESVAAQLYAEAIVAGIDRDFIPTDASRIVAHTALTDPGKSASVEFTAPSAPGNYTYLCTFPGHFLAGMKGTLTVRAR
jgi:azurin